MVFKAIPHALGRMASMPTPVAGALPNLPGGPTLQSALDRIAQLEARLAKLESAISVDDNGLVTIFSQADIVLSADGAIVIDGSTAVSAQCQGNVLSLGVSKIAMTSSSTLDIAASRIQFDASKIQVASPLFQCSGIVKCDVMQSNTVIAATYTPGAGNIW